MIIYISLHSLIWKCIFYSSIIKALILSLRIAEDNSAEFKLIKNFTDSLCTSESSLIFIMFTELNLQIYLKSCIKI